MDELSTISGAHRSHREYREGAHRVRASAAAPRARDALLAAAC